MFLPIFHDKRFFFVVVVVVVAQEDRLVRPTKYIEVGTTLTLVPDPSAVQRPVKSIRWKYGTSLVLDWASDNLIYYGSFSGRTTLDPQTLRLDINSSTMADSGDFTLETNSGTVKTYEVEVISKYTCILCVYTWPIRRKFDRHPRRIQWLPLPQFRSSVGG